MILRLTVIGLIVILTGFNVWQTMRIETLSQSLGELQNTLASLDEELGGVASTTANSAAELERRSQVVARAENNDLQDAVAAATPAVVSIVESREVPRLQISYENPFGSDPFFRDFGIRVPVYRQVGTTTQRVGAGTGFLVRANGYIVTNRHVVDDTDATYTVLLSTGTQREASIVWRSPDQDLAVIKISGSGYPSIPLGDSSALRLGQSVFAVGNALGEYNNSVSVGVISGLNRSVQAADSQGRLVTLNNVIQTDAAINPGNSGGPLVNLAGRAVGINVAMVSGSQNIGFAIPINNIKQALAQLGI